MEYQPYFYLVLEEDRKIILLTIDLHQLLV